MIKNKALVIFSGGQDSTVCLYWAKNRFLKVCAITFNYEQKHSIEIKCSEKIAKMEKVEQKIINISFLGELIDSALLTHGDMSALNEKKLPASFVPNRNQLFITLAHAYAQTIQAGTLVTGVCQTDYSGYPDCRQDFIKAIEHASNLGSQSQIKIETPLMYLNKAETFQLAKKEGCLEQVIKYSHTCYNNDRTVLHDWGYGCGECPACKLRERGYNQAISENML